jgi:hypothetical protein
MHYLHTVLLIYIIRNAAFPSGYVRVYVDSVPWSRLNTQAGFPKTFANTAELARDYQVYRERNLKSFQDVIEQTNLSQRREMREILRFIILYR